MTTRLTKETIDYLNGPELPKRVSVQVKTGEFQDSSGMTPAEQRAARVAVIRKGQNGLNEHLTHRQADHPELKFSSWNGRPFFTIITGDTSFIEDLAKRPDVLLITPDFKFDMDQSRNRAH